jgi:hypothetical protein
MSRRAIGAIGVLVWAWIVPGGDVTARVRGLADEPIQSVSAQFELKRGHAGALEVGEPIEDVYQGFGRDRITLTPRFAEGMFTPVLEIALAGSAVVPALVVDVREVPCARFSVWAIEVYDRRFRTKEGLGIGSSLRDVRRAYSTQIVVGEGHTAAFAREIGISFRISTAAPADDAVVVSVTVVADPQLVRQRRCPGR